MIRKKRTSRRPHRRNSRGKLNLRSRGLEVGILFLVLIFMVFLFSVIYRLTQVPEKPMPVEQKIVRVEVLNGCGKAGLAKEVTDFLRIKGFDVVNMGNAENFEFPETIVVDRVGEMSYAWKVARAVGVDNVIQQKDEDLFLEVTLILGKDCAELAPLREILGGD
jgi:hypothetical protein